MALDLHNFELLIGAEGAELRFRLRSFYFCCIFFIRVAMFSACVTRDDLSTHACREGYANQDGGQGPSRSLSKILI